MGGFVESITLDQEAIMSVMDDFRKSPYRTSNHNTTRSHCFDEHHAKRLLAGLQIKAKTIFLHLLGQLDLADQAMINHAGIITNGTLRFSPQTMPAINVEAKARVFLAQQLQYRDSRFQTF